MDSLLKRKLVDFYEPDPAKRQKTGERWTGRVARERSANARKPQPTIEI